MRTKSFSGIVFAVILTPFVLCADHPDSHNLKHDGSADLQRIKSLAGTWKGTSDMGHGEQKIVVTYKVTGGGSAVVETMHPDTPMEMVSVYHDDSGKMAMTHYCMLGNHPLMRLSGSDAKSLSLAMTDNTGLQRPDEPHMHNLKINFIDADTIEHQWTFFDKGKAENIVSFRLTRSK